MARKSSSGFTLIELILVVAIIGMLLTVAVPNLMRSRDAAESAVAMGQLRALHSKPAMYRSQRDRYARLGELNTFSNNALGKTVGSTIHHRDFIFLMFPTPTDTSLLSGYQIIAYRIRQGRVVSQFQMAEDGSVRTVLP